MKFAESIASSIPERFLLTPLLPFGLLLPLRCL
jgi:hypothetical protein